MIGSGVLDGLNVIVDGDRDGAGGAGKISADHEHDAEFAESVSEGEDGGGNYTGERKRKNDLAKGAQGIGAEGARSGEEFWVEAFERGDEWLRTERKAVEDAGDDEAGESERKRVAEESEPEFAERAARTQGDEEIETEDGGGKNEWKSDDGLNQKFRSPFGEGQPVGERRRQNEKNCCDEEGQAEGEEEFGHGVWRAFISEWDGRGIQVWQNRIFRGWPGRQAISRTRGRRVRLPCGRKFLARREIEEEECNDFAEFARSGRKRMQERK